MTVHDEVRTKRLILEDDEGRTRAELKMSPGGPSLYLYTRERPCRLGALFGPDYPKSIEAGIGSMRWSRMSCALLRRLQHPLVGTDLMSYEVAQTLGAGRALDCDIQRFDAVEAKEIIIRGDDGAMQAWSCSLHSGSQ